MKIYAMYKIIFKVVSISDAETMKKMQQTINLWLTQGKLKKYKTTPVGDNVLFELCIIKEQGE
jgi:hypothetical protein